MSHTDLRPSAPSLARPRIFAAPDLRRAARGARRAARRLRCARRLAGALGARERGRRGALDWGAERVHAVGCQTSEKSTRLPGVRPKPGGTILTGDGDVDDCDGDGQGDTMMAAATTAPTEGQAQQDNLRHP